MGDDKVVVFGSWGSPFSKRVEMALKLKGVEYEYVEEDLANKSELLLQYNPIHKKVPVLVHNGKPIVESVVILEYIEETWKSYPILPHGPYDRAMARFWAKFIDEKCMPTVWKIVWTKDEKERMKTIEEACENLKTLETGIKDSRFFGGETIGLPDIVCSFFGFWCAVFEEALGMELITREKFPILCNWIDEFANISVIKDCLPPRDKLLATLRARFNAFAWKY